MSDLALFLYRDHFFASFVAIGAISFVIDLATASLGRWIATDRGRTVWGDHLKGKAHRYGFGLLLLADGLLVGAAMWLFVIYLEVLGG